MEDVFVFIVLLVFEYMLYTTGAFVLRVFSFGLLKYQIYSYKEFKALKKKFDKNLLLQYIVGIAFYALIIVAIAWLN